MDITKVYKPNLALITVVPHWLETVTATGQYKGYFYFITDGIRFGGGNGYVLIQPGQKGYDYHQSYEDDIDITCHGGITWDTHDKYDNRIIGFDTAHPDDYDKMFPKLGGMFGMPPHKWTEPELEDQCKLIIRQLNKKA